MATAQMGNAIARQYFLHDNDEDRDGNGSCYFSQTGDEDGWGFWVSPTGRVVVDEASANGNLPTQRIIDACVRAAKKHFAR